MKTSEPNDYGEIYCKCNRCGDIKQALPFTICDRFSNCSGCYEAIEYDKCEDCGAIVPSEYLAKHQCGD